MAPLEVPLEFLAQGEELQALAHSAMFLKQYSSSTMQLHYMP